MTPKCLQLCVAGLLFLQLFACKPCPQELTDADKVLLEEERFLNSFLDDNTKITGYSVDSIEAGECFTAYTTAMQLHNITDTPLLRKAVTVDGRRITQTEIFSYNEVKKFLKKEAKKYENRGFKKMSVKIQFGVYTQKYFDYVIRTLKRNRVDQVVINQANDNSRIGRVGIFVVTEPRGDQALLKPEDNNKMVGDKTQVFDFGALQP
ncbi:MAG: hypothetical protein J7623_13120 [Chitinophaga sp.]|uniref:hypothetical protein n=1 Tax=Chitinophaga sp. TaxID=1869181 RepID=UPI001B0DEFD6|nr:hypothetical protein [Chitinophaga sp.]MBO9729572.1 hypothetical protein [Chitinophaga sp.]